MPCPGCVEALDGKSEEVVEEVEAVEFLGLANAELFAQDSRRTRHRASDHVKITEYLKFYLLSKVIYCTSNICELDRFWWEKLCCAVRNS